MSARSPKKRAPSKGPKKRAGGNHGNGRRTRFKPGQNSHTGEVFRRGPDDIPRGSIKLMYGIVLRDNRQKIFDQLSKLCTTPRGALAFAEAAGDRLEGKPTQKHEVHTPRTTIFERDPDPAPLSEPGPVGAPAPVPEGVLVQNGQTFVAVRERL